MCILNRSTEVEEKKEKDIMKWKFAMQCNPPSTQKSL